MSTTVARGIMIEFICGSNPQKPEGVQVSLGGPHTVLVRRWVVSARMMGRAPRAAAVPVGFAGQRDGGHRGGGAGACFPPEGLRIW